MENMTPISVINLMPSTDVQVETFSDYVINAILESEIDFRQFLYQKKIIEKTFDAISENKDVKEFMLKEIEKYGKEGVVYNDLKFEISSRKIWDYANTGDSTLEEMEKGKAYIDNQIKERKKLLNLAKKPFADIETGEIIYPSSCKETVFIKSSKIK